MGSEHPSGLRNRLREETSPYLLQHADNPVAWQPWDDAALAYARETDTPILLSIGYSACHWCHVMAHESFEDAATAAVMNERFVNIKVDREERPDLDRVYQTAHQLLAQRPGGWPLTVFLAPDDLTPFFAGTYFPRTPRFGMPGFQDVLRRVHAAFVEQRDQLREQNAALRHVFERLSPPPSDETSLDDAPVVEARRVLETAFDRDNGGFGGAPKFPHPATLQFLLHQRRRAGDAPAVRMATFTLECMAERGLYDQLGGGFFRYCVDAEWRIPHFEKMLYDNGPLLALYADAYAVTRNDAFARAASETAEWAAREMQSPEGGFHSALDADSDGREGGFYVWTRDDVHAALDGHPLLETLTVAHYGLDEAPNFEGEWHLNILRDADALAEQHNLTPEDARALLDKARGLLFEHRAQRVRPGRDDKILTSWNALMIGGLARSARRLQQPRHAEAADRALAFIRRELWQDGRLLAAYKDGRARFNAYLDDHAFLLDAVLELLECRWRSADLAFARDLAHALLERFEDREHGGFFFTSHDHERLIHRPKPFADEATPSGNGVAALALIRLGNLLGDETLLHAAERCLHAAQAAIRHAPHAHTTLLAALELWNRPGEIVILRGEPETMREWQREIERDVVFGRMTCAIPGDEQGLSPSLALREPKGPCVAYVCRGSTCSPAITDKAQLHEWLSAST